MNLPYSESGDVKVEALSHIFDKKSESYKLFWFQAIVNKVLEGRRVLSYDELVNEMIADSWYMVTEYKLNLGPSDNLEMLVHYIHDISGMKTNEKKETILNFLNSCSDKKVASLKRKITNHVPYRLQSAFMEEMVGKKEWDVSESKQIEKINKERLLMYYISDLAGMKTTILMQPMWCDYLIKNQEIVKGWIQYHLIIYLQRRNPDVPGIIEKLNPPLSRKLNDIMKYWKLLMKLGPVREIYSNRELTEKEISIDHFVPWSYVAHDEFWNLHPTTVSINSQKGNSLPNWAKYFPALGELEYFSYEMMWKYDVVHAEFEKCERHHVNSNDVRMKLYRAGLGRDEFCSNLEHILLPVYESAKNAGFGNWPGITIG